VISANALTRRFGSRTAVENVSFDVSRAEIVALLGPNGAGKTTTIRMLAGLIAPTSGSVMIDGSKMTPSTGRALRGRIGFLTEAPGLWDRLTVRENLKVYAGLYQAPDGDAAVDRAMELFGLSDRSATRAAELSKGMRQKVALARAMLHDPAILLLDEPTSGLDPEVRRDVRRLLEEKRAASCAILVSTHNLDEAERLADRVAVVDRQLLAFDRPAVLRRRLSSRRVSIRVAGDARRFIDRIGAWPGAVAAEGAVLLVPVADSERDTPAIVRALVAAGADVLEVRPEIPALEDVYLHLIRDSADGSVARS
jgi:ABC-2 type transport system ATP-binding protein